MHECEKARKANSRGENHHNIYQSSVSSIFSASATVMNFDMSAPLLVFLLDLAEKLPLPFSYAIAFAQAFSMSVMTEPKMALVLGK